MDPSLPKSLGKVMAVLDINTKGDALAIWCISLIFLDDESISFWRIDSFRQVIHGKVSIAGAELLDCKICENLTANDRAQIPRFDHCADATAEGDLFESVP